MLLLSVSENILLFISGIGVFQAILLAALLLFHPKSDKSVNLYLAAYICSLALPIILPVAQHFFSWQMMVLLEPSLALIAPFLYLYVRSFKEVITWKKIWPHLLFFFLCIPMALWNYFTVGAKYPPTPAIPQEAVRNFVVLIPFTLRLIQRIIYYFLARTELNRYQRSIVQLFSDTSRINLNWVRWLINGYLALILITLVFYPLMIKVPQYFSWWVLIPGTLVSIYVYVATFKGVTQLTLWQIHPDINKEKLEEELHHAATIETEGSAGEDANVIETQNAPNEKIRPRKAGLNESRIDDIVAKIIKVMETEKLYQEPELTSQQLAGKLDVPVHHLSQAINDGLKKNFYDLVNNYRVEEAKRLLVDPKNNNFTILSVGFEAGFNSKTTFNTVFKKFTGLTPTDFREKQKLELAPA